MQHHNINNMFTSFGDNQHLKVTHLYMPANLVFCNPIFHVTVVFTEMLIIYLFRSLAIYICVQGTDRAPVMTALRELIRGGNAALIPVSSKLVGPLLPPRL